MIPLQALEIAAALIIKGTCYSVSVTEFKEAGVYYGFFLRGIHPQRGPWYCNYCLSLDFINYCPIASALEILNDEIQVFFESN